MIPIARGYADQIKAGMSILEIGCGTWGAIRSHCEGIGAHYEGIDVCPEYFGKPVVATRLENLAELSFAGETFDIVLGNQTMEHWAEHGCPLSWGLYQCFRVCKPRGRVFMNVPIHFHGTRDFMLGRLDRLKRVFAQFSETTSFEPWGVSPSPLPPLLPHPGYLPLRSKAAFVLNIEAVKDIPTPDLARGFSATGRMAQLLNYPLSYIAYRIFRKAVGKVSRNKSSNST